MISFYFFTLMKLLHFIYTVLFLHNEFINQFNLIFFSLKRLKFNPLTISTIIQNAHLFVYFIETLLIYY